MENKIWINEKLDIGKALQDQKYEELLKYSYENQQYVIEQWWSEDKKFFGKILRFGTSILRYFETHIRNNPMISAVFRLGALMGTIECFNQLLREEKQDMWSLKVFKEEMLSIKHLDEIILSLELHGIMSHSELGKDLDLKVTTLSEIMKKAEWTQMIYSSRVGKYKVYSLTDFGRRVGKQLRKERRGGEDQELLVQIEKRLQSSEYSERLRKMITNVLDKNRKTEYDYVNAINPGDDLTVTYKEGEEIYKDRYEVLAVARKEEPTDSRIHVMAKKQKFDRDMIGDFEKRKEMYA